VVKFLINFEIDSNSRLFKARCECMDLQHKHLHQKEVRRELSISRAPFRWHINEQACLFGGYVLPFEQTYIHLCTGFARLNWETRQTHSKRSWPVRIGLCRREIRGVFDFKRFFDKCWYRDVFDFKRIFGDDLSTSANAK